MLVCINQKFYGKILLGFCRGNKHWPTKIHHQCRTLLGQVLDQADDITNDLIQRLHTETEVFWPTCPIILSPSFPLTPPETIESEWE